MTDFEEYKQVAELSKREKTSSWATVMGLQAVDGLQPSEFLNYHSKSTRTINNPPAERLDTPTSTPTSSDGILSVKGLMLCRELLKWRKENYLFGVKD